MAIENPEQRILTMGMRLYKFITLLIVPLDNVSRVVRLMLHFAADVHKFVAETNVALRLAYITILIIRSSAFIALCIEGDIFRRLTRMHFERDSRRKWLNRLMN